MFFEKLQTIKAFIFDVDGVLTDGTIHVTETGDELRSFNIKDGYALQLAIKQGYILAIISGARSQGITTRLNRLGIKSVYTGVDNKLSVFEKFINENNLCADNIVYMGDDIPDLLVMKKVGLPCCPADAAEEIKTISSYISPKNGGYGCVRDIIEKVLKIQDKWFVENPSAYDGSN
ncbi:MAG TPA: HAD-IIIA family hydrolase [Sphingobacteriaceae bacterium]|nr:HAD-IIIA family hydrolase [Sphingobacteriaceae bacterium]